MDCRGIESGPPLWKSAYYGPSYDTAVLKIETTELRLAGAAGDMGKPYRMLVD
jgi:hypothetical protein